MLTRQKVLLSMLRGVGGGASKLQLTKWCFLLLSETSSKGGNAFYEFVPYRYGPFSFSLYWDLGKLREKGLLQDEENGVVHLTDAGMCSGVEFDSRLQNDVTATLHRYAGLPVGELLDSVYSRYPWYTINSVRCFKPNVPRPKASIAIHTIGYEGRQVDGLLDALLRSGVNCLIDVRRNPVARRYGLHKSSLSRLCDDLSISYHHFPQLGVPSALREALRRDGDYSTFFAEYEKRVASEEMTSVDRVGELVLDRPAALMCMEADPARCHRSRLASLIARRTSLSVRHLGSDQ